MGLGDVFRNPMARGALGDSFPASPQHTIGLMREAGVDADSHILHLGCGPGTVPAMLAEEFGCKVTGVVELAAFLDIARENLDGPAGDRLAFEHAPLEMPPFPPFFFSHVLVEARAAVLNLDAVLIAARAMLAPGGRLVLNEPVLATEGRWPPALAQLLASSSVSGRVHLRRPAEMEAALAGAGFIVPPRAPAPEVVERIAAKLRQLAPMLGMAMRFGGFDPAERGLEMTKDEILGAVGEMQTALSDGTFEWMSWTAQAA